MNTVELSQQVSQSELPASPKLLWMRERFGWMGSHSGYDMVCETIAKLQPGDYTSVWNESSKRLPRPIRRLMYRVSKGAQVSPYYSAASTASELAALWQIVRNRPELIHVTYTENNLGILPRFKQSFGFKLVGTVHHPVSWWRLHHPHPNSITALEALIVLSSREVAYFEQFLPDRVFCLPHGVDTDFFYPATNSNSDGAFRCVFSGLWLRDFPTLAQVIDEVLKRNPAIQFDIILPRSKRKDWILHRIARHDQVAWHADLSDEQLRTIYQRASLFVLPILDCTANNALLEAIACGLPVVSNDVGGMGDYTRPTFAQLLPVGAVEGFTAAILHLAEDHQKRQAMGAAARSFAEEYLNWERIAQETLKVYRFVSQAGGLS